MTNYKVGDIVAVDFPFSDLQGIKRRPGLVVATDEHDVLLARVTTHPARGVCDVRLEHWADANLPRASTVRLSKLATMDQRLVHHVVGHLNPQDAQAIANAWQQLTAILVVELLK